MSDHIKGGDGNAETQTNAAAQPGERSDESDAAKRRSKLEELARRRAEQPPKPAEVQQEVLPPEGEGEGRGKLRELLRKRREGGAGGGGRLGRRGGGPGAAGEGEGGRRGEVLRRLLKNRRSGDDNRGDGEGRLVRRLRERGGGSGSSRREADLEERVRRLEEELDRLRDRDDDPPRRRGGWR